jgi:hypothetical protein
LGLGTWKQVDRVQSIDKTGTINKLKVEEQGRDGVVEYVDQPPSVTYRMSQYEYGNLEVFRTLANLSDSATTVTLNDFKASTFDICSYLTDDSGVFKGTVWIPKQRLTGFNVNIKSPTGLIERSFDFIGEDWITWQGANKYLIYKEETVESGDIVSGDSAEFTVSAPVAVEDPDDSVYILRVAKITALGVSSELVAGTGYSYSAGTGKLTVEDVTVGDLIKYWYSAGSYITGQSVFTNNNSDLPAIHADSASIYLATGNYLYRLQNVAIDVKLERFDVGEIGSNEVVTRGVRTKTVTITLDRNLEDFVFEEILAGQTVGYGKLDIRKFSDKFTLRVKLYSSPAKTTFKIGFKAIDLAPSEIRRATSIGNYVTLGNTLTGQDLTIANDVAVIDA